MKKIILLLALLYAGISQAQDSLKYPLADTYYKKSNEAFDAENYDTACKYSQLHLGIELALDSPRNKKVIDAYILQAFCEFREQRYRTAIEVYNKALKWMNNSGSAKFAQSFFEFINLCYKQMQQTDSVYFTYSDRDYRKSFVFRIEEVLSQEGAKFRVRINAGLNDGLIPGAIAFGISAPLPDSVEERKFELGKGEIVAVEPWSAIAEITIPNEYDTYNHIQVGDMVETRIFSKFKDETILYKLLSSDVSFKDNYREQMVNPRYIIHYDSKEFLSLQLLLMADQIFETEEFTREGDIFINPATEGQNIGKSIHDLFLNPDTADILDYLGFVAYFPRKYMGKDYKVNETYATWLLNNSPSTPAVILDSLLNEDSYRRRLEIYEFNKTDLTKDFYENWEKRATEYASKQEYDKAIKTNNLLMEVAALRSDKLIKTRALLSRGKIYKEQNQYEIAIKYFDSASTGFLHLKDTLEHIRAIYNMAQEYGDWGRYKLAVEKFDLAITKLNKRIGRKGNYDEWELMAYILWDKGYNVSQNGDYDGALAAYDKAEKILDSIGGSKSDRANVYRNIAYVSKKKGLYEQALEKYRTAMELFLAAAKQEKYATVQDDIADTYFKMGNYRVAIEYYTKAYEIKLTLDDKSGAGFSKSNIGQAYWNLGLYDSAILLHSEAVVLRKEGNDIVGTAYSYEKIADLWKESGNMDSAISYYQTAEAYYVANNDTTDKLAALKEAVGSLYFKVKNYDRAIYFYKRSQQIYTSIHNDLGIANSLYNLGISYYEMKSFVQARDYLLQAKKAYEKMKDKENTMYAVMYLSLVSWDADNNYPEAERLMRQALALAKETNSTTNQAYTWRQIGRLKVAQGQLDAAKKYYDSSLTAYNEIGDYAGAGYTKISLGHYYIDKGQFDTAQKLFSSVANEATEKKNFFLASSANISLADYYNLAGEYDSAKKVANSSLEFNKEVKNEYLEAGAYISLGNTYNYLADYKTSVKYYRLSDSIYKAANDPTSRATPKNNVGTIYFYQGDYRNALIQFNEVYEELKRTKYEGDLLSIALLNIGEVYLEDGVLPEAEKWLTQALAVSKKGGNQRGISSANLLLGKVKLKQKKYKEAKTYLFTAYKSYNAMGEKERIIEANSFIGRLYFETNKNDSARYYLNNAVSIAQQTGNTKYQWEPLYISSMLYTRNKDTANAVEDLKKAVNIIENIKGNIAGRKEFLVSFAKAGEKYKLYQDLVDLLIARNDVGQAFYYQEKSNIAGLLEQTRGGDNGPSRSNELLDGVAEENTAKELELKIDGYYAELIKEKSKPKEKQSAEKIKALEALINVNETNFQQFVDSSMKASGKDEVGSFSSNINPRDLDNARFSLPDEDVVIEYLATENQLIIFVASNSTLNARKVNIKEKDLALAINDFYTQVITAKSDKKIVLANSDKLYQIFIAPIEDLIQDKKQLALVPTGIIYKLPMQALGKLEGDKIHYLIQDHNITYINNLRFIYQAQASGAIEIRGLFFGNPDKSLSNAEKEVKDIVSIYPSSALFVGDSATENKAKELIGKFNTVHFATHGRLDPVKFENSYLVMAPNAAAGDDGRLTMLEIRQIKKLNSIKLLVLSACDMAVSEEQVEGWVNTPANEFIMKGVGTVVAPQWKVHDEATSYIIVDFYKNINSGEGFAEALKNSQLKLAADEKFSHPYYWSAFITVGSW